MFRIIKFFSVLGLIAITGLNSYAQSNSKLCIIFDKNTKYISVDIPNDSTGASFTIVREGFETKEKREKAMKKWLEAHRIAISPTFYYNFVSIHKPVKIDSKKELDECIKIVSVNEYRKDEFEEPKNASDGLFIFIKKLPNGTYLKWMATFMVQM